MILVIYLTQIVRNYLIVSIDGRDIFQFKTYLELGQQNSDPILVDISAKTPNSLDILQKQDFLQIISLISVSLAIKTEETEKCTFWELQQLINTSYTNEQLLEAEQLVLETLEWNLNLPTCFELTHRLLTFVNHQYDFSILLSKTQEFIDL